MPRPKKEVDKKLVDRRIFFYRVNAGVQETGEPKNVSFGPALRTIDHMPFSDGDNGRYLASKDDDRELCCWVDKSQSPYQFKLAYIRRSEHPPVEHDGELSPLPLPRGQGLAELTHFMIFPKGIVGAEFNFFGPRASQFSFYCALKLKNAIPGFRLNPLLRRDLQKQLAKLSEVKMLDLKIKSSYANVIQEANADLGSAFKATARAMGARANDDLEIFFRRKKTKESSPNLTSFDPRALVRFVQKMSRRGDLREQVSTFKIQGVTADETRLVDVLSEQFVIDVKVRRAADHTSAVDSQSVYTAIEDAYTNVVHDLDAADELEA